MWRSEEKGLPNSGGPFSIGRLNNQLKRELYFDPKWARQKTWKPESNWDSPALLVM